MIRPGIRRLFRIPRWRPELAERELDEEIRLHLELRTEQLQRRGMSAEAARVEARRRFGPAGESRGELSRAARRRDERLRLRERLGAVRQDARYALRSLGRTPGLVAVIVLTLALGIGLCTSIYSVVRGVILDPVPFPEPRQLLSVELSGEGSPGIPLYSDFLVWEEEAAPVVDLAAYTLGSRRIGSGRATVEAFSVRVSGDFFGVLRARPHLGRTLVPADASAASDPAAVISHHLWRSLFGGDPSVVGRPVQVGGRTYALVGVLAPGQGFPAPVDVWTPLAPTPEEAGALRVTPIGRLAPGVTRERASAAFEAVHRSLVAERAAAERGSRPVIGPLTGRPNDSAGPVALLLAIAVGSILLIGIANASGLMFTRALARSHEIAIRASLGASRCRIAALLLTESLLVALAAAAAGLLVAHLALAGFRRSIPETLTRQMLGWDQVAVDGSIAAFAIVLALLAGVASGLAPVLGAARPDVARALQQSPANATSGPRGSRLLRMLVASEVALSVALLLCAGLLTRSLLALVGTEPGFHTEGVAVLRWSVPNPADGSPEELVQWQRELLARAEAVPGIASAALTSDLPAIREGFGAARGYELEGSRRAQGRAEWRTISPGFLTALRVPLLRGRPLAPSDNAEAPRVAVVSAALARRHSRSGEDVLGRQIAASGEVWTVVGVAGDVRGIEPGAGPEQAIYVPQEQSPTSKGHLVLRHAAPLDALAGTLRDALWSADPAVALGAVRPLDEVVDELAADQRIVATLVGAYAATALVITLASLYAIVAYLVVRHRREHGIRAALGASPRRIVRTAMRRVLAAALAGTLVGTMLALGLARLISGVLYGITPLEPSVFGTLPLLLVGLFALAIYLPARRAAKVDPITMLRT